MKAKVICVHTGRVPTAVNYNSTTRSLTLYKIYDGFIYPSPATTIQVVDDSGYVKTYKGERFMRLDEFRERKLKELGI